MQYTYEKGKHSFNLNYNIDTYFFFEDNKYKFTSEYI